MEEPVPPTAVPLEEPQPALSKKRSLDEENVQTAPDETDNDDPEKLSRKKKSRWGTEDESKPPSDDEDNHRSYSNRRSERYIQQIQFRVTRKSPIQFQIAGKRNSTSHRRNR